MIVGDALVMLIESESEKCNWRKKFRWGKKKNKKSKIKNKKINKKKKKKKKKNKNKINYKNFLKN